MPWTKIGMGWVGAQAIQTKLLHRKDFGFGMDGKSQLLKCVCWGGGRVQTDSEKEQDVFLDKDKIQGCSH